MGNYQTKEQQLILTQQGSIAGKAEERYNQLSMWLIAIVSLLGVLILFYVWNRGCKGLKAWLRKQATVISVSTAQFQQQRANVLNVPHCNRAAAAPAAADTVPPGYA